jgi:hypothetical protein
MNCSSRNSSAGRREFLQAMAMAGSAMFVPSAFEGSVEGTKLEIAEMIGALRMESGRTPIAGASMVQC